MSALDRFQSLAFLLQEISRCQVEIEKTQRIKARLNGGSHSAMDELIEILSARATKSQDEAQWCFDKMAPVEETDPVMFQVLSLRFIEGAPWERVAKQIPAAGSAEAVKKRVYRWLATLEE